MPHADQSDPKAFRDDPRVNELKMMITDKVFSVFI